MLRGRGLFSFRLASLSFLGTAIFYFFSDDLSYYLML